MKSNPYISVIDGKLKSGYGGKIEIKYKHKPTVNIYPVINGKKVSQKPDSKPDNREAELINAKSAAQLKQIMEDETL